MAPITDTVVDDLKSTVNRLEKRIAELENRLSGHGGQPSSQESIRMILMGPPGAGEKLVPRIETNCEQGGLHGFHRQGHTSTEDQGEVLCLLSCHRGYVTFADFERHSFGYVVILQPMLERVLNVVLVHRQTSEKYPR